MKPGLEVIAIFVLSILLSILLRGRLRGMMFACWLLFLTGWLTTSPAFGLQAQALSAFAPTGTLAGVGFALLGGLIGWLTAEGVRSCAPHGLGSAAFQSSVLALVWVGGYGYRYNFDARSASGFSVFAFLLWSLALCLVLATARRFESMGLGWWKGLIALCTAYWCGLLALEYVGYEWFGVREVARGVYHQPLVFGLIHGPWYMKVFYVTAGPVLAGLDRAWRQGATSLCGGRTGWNRPARGPAVGRVALACGGMGE